MHGPMADQTTRSPRGMCDDYKSTTQNWDLNMSITHGQLREIIQRITTQGPDNTS